MKRYEKKLVLEFEAPDAITFEVSNEKNGKIIIKANIDQPSFCSQNCSKQTHSLLKETEIKYVDTSLKENYANPPIPPGYIYIRGKWNDGFIIERESDESQFVWIPVGFLNPNGTLDGHSFDSKFGRRCFYKRPEIFSIIDSYCYFNPKPPQIKEPEIFSRKDFYEPLTPELQMQIKSVEKYGGFYISRYNISMSKYGKPQSKRCEIPLECIRDEILQLASSFENTDTIKSHLTYGAEYDSVLEWFMKSGKKTAYSIVIDSTSWGNYFDGKQQNSYSKEKAPQLTGISDTWCVNRLYDFAGNVTELTQEEYNFNKASVCRGGDFRDSGKTWAAATRRVLQHYSPKLYEYGFHIALYLKP